MNIQHRELDRERTHLLQLALSSLSAVMHTDELVLGGGTALAARWQHRVSTDIDLFTSDRVWQRVRPELSKLAVQLHEREATRISRQSASFVHFETANGREFSVGGNASCTSNPIADEDETSTGIRLHTSAEIMVRKVRSRMLNAPLYNVRDAYDIVTCMAVEPEALSEAKAVLVDDELMALAYDAGQSDIVLNTDQPLIQPSCKAIAEPGLLRDLLFGVLTGDITQSALVAAHFSARFEGTPPSGTPFAMPRT